MKEFFDQVLFHLGSRDIAISHLIWVGLFVLAWIMVFRIIAKGDVHSLYKKYYINERQQQKLRNILLLIMLCTSLIMIAWLLEFDLEIIAIQDKVLRTSHLIKGLCIWQVARLINWLVNNVYIHSYYIRGASRIPTEPSEDERRATSTVRYIVYLLALLLMLNTFNLNYTLWTTDVNGIPIKFGLSNIVKAGLVLLFAQLLVSLIAQLLMRGMFGRKSINPGAQFAITQLLKYVIYVFAFIWALDFLGINISLLLGGAAALLVGVGLGLQQTFNDFISGIVLLFERSISVGDVVNVGGTVGKVEKIGMRASTIETRENKNIIVPNSKLVNDLVDNWSHFDPTVRFEVNVGVAYGSDTQLVKELLLASAEAIERVLDFPKPFVRFNDFGDSALLFTVYFFVNDSSYYLDITSDLRFEIDRRFKEHNISIPFPQRDVWIKKD